MTDIIDKLADIEHQQWSHWTKYMLDNMSEENVTRWKRQIETPYAELTEKEKESDRAWARKVLTTLPASSIRDEALEEAAKWLEDQDWNGRELQGTDFLAQEMRRALKSQEAE